MALNVIKLNSRHEDLLKPLFEADNIMGMNSGDTNSFMNNSTQQMQIRGKSGFFEHFCNSYLGQCKNYHAFGVLDDSGKLICMMSFYESIDEASWYGTLVRSIGGNIEALRECLDALIRYNEANGRYKYYIMVPKRYSNVYRRFLMSDWAKARYDSVDEFFVKARQQCKYTLAWQILYSRLLIPTDTVVKCLYLRRDARVDIPNGGVVV